MIVLGLCLIVAGSACSASDDDAGPPGTPPLGFGVQTETDLVELLAHFGMSDQTASCVASAAFAADPPTLFTSDGSYDISQALLADAGRGCGVEWSDYDFSTGD